MSEYTFDHPGDDGVLQPEDSLMSDDLAADPLDTGIIPPDRWSAGEGFGNTQEEADEGESLDMHLAEEEPDPTQDVTFGDDEVPDTWGDGPGPRSGRLVGDGIDTLATDVGVDAGAATAEEAAMHVLPEDAADTE